MTYDEAGYTREEMMLEAEQDEFGAQFGDPRRCSIHGHVTSSPDGRFDTPCPACEWGDDALDFAAQGFDAAAAEYDSAEIEAQERERESYKDALAESDDIQF